MKWWNRLFGDTVEERVQNLQRITPLESAAQARPSRPLAEARAELKRDSFFRKGYEDLHKQ